MAPTCTARAILSVPRLTWGQCLEQCSWWSHPAILLRGQAHGSPAYGRHGISTAALSLSKGTVALRYVLGALGLSGAAAVASPDTFQLCLLIPTRLARDVYTAGMMVAGKSVFLSCCWAAMVVRAC